MNAGEQIYVIGIGDDGFEGLTVGAKSLLQQADLLVGPPHALALISAGAAERLEINADLDGVVERLTGGGYRRAVVLMMGDPLFYGTTRFLCDRLGKDRLEVVPHVSSMQMAFARVKESWDEAYLANIATQGLDRVIEQARTAEKVGLFTTEEVTPAVVAQSLLDNRIDYFTAYICENLGAPDECVTSGDLAEVAQHEFSALNVMILVRKPNRPEQPSGKIGQRLFGNPDEAFLQSRPKRGLLTPAEVRCIALAELNLNSASVVWDVGAGSGSVAIEAARIASAGTVYAIEMDVADFQLITANAQRFGVRNLVPVLGKAPEAWTDLPDPEAIFVGGTGRQVSQIVDQAFQRLRPGGRLVANVSSIENVAAVRQVLHAKTDDDQVWMINVARGVYQIERVRFEALNPTFLIAAAKP
ncbi:MAG: precorrin-6y C5,15-methyltransferase (decarboxylating) subunit CbiE [Pirellulaceae bacterium]|nr:precorrin-6y C5,15-methyltransferase (decarboxylating) subunit CbiE [Pirellulaceae bacterium]